MIHPNNNYWITEANEEQYKFKNKLIAVVTKFTHQVGPFFQYADVLKI